MRFQVIIAHKIIYYQACILYTYSNGIPIAFSSSKSPPLPPSSSDVPLHTRIFHGNCTWQRIPPVNGLLHTRCPVLSTDQAIPSCFYFRISWISMEQRCFYFFLSPRVSGGPQKLQTLTASKTECEKFGPKI